MHFLLVYLLCIFPFFPLFPSYVTFYLYIVVWPWTSYLLNFPKPIFLASMTAEGSWLWQLCSLPSHLLSNTLFHWDQCPGQAIRKWDSIYKNPRDTLFFWNAAIISQEVGHSECEMVLLHHFLQMAAARAHREQWWAGLRGLRIITGLPLTAHLLRSRHSARRLANVFSYSQQTCKTKFWSLFYRKESSFKRFAQDLRSRRPRVQGCCISFLSSDGFCASFLVAPFSTQAEFIVLSRLSGCFS